MSSKNPTVKVVEHEPIELITDDDGNFIGGIGNEPNKVPIIHKGFDENDIRQKYVQYAYKLGGIEFVSMIECENGNWNIKAVGDGGYAFGLCQMNTNYHELPDGYLDVWQVQVEYCYKKRSTGTKFYGPSRVSKATKGMKCSQYVKDRFILE